MNATRHNLELRGYIQTLTPFANSPSECKGKNKEQLLPTMPVHRGQGIVGESVPYIAASAIRGMLRRAAAEIAFSVAPNGRGGFEDWMLHAVGGAKGKGEDKCDPRVRHEYINGNQDHGGNPLVALFGAGRADAGDSSIGGMIGSKLHISHAICPDDVAPELIQGARFHEDKSDRPLEFLDDGGVQGVLGYMQANSKRAELASKLKEVKRSIKGSAKQKEDDPQVKKITGELKAQEMVVEKFAGSDAAIGRPLPGYQVIPAGVEIEHLMTLAAVTDVQLGFFLDTLRRFAIDPVIGAHRSHGCGRIRAKYAAYLHDGEGVRHYKGDILIGEFPPEKGADGARPWPPLGDRAEFFKADDKITGLAADWRKSVKWDNLRPYRGGSSDQKKKADQ